MIKILNFLKQYGVLLLSILAVFGLGIWMLLKRKKINTEKADRKADKVLVRNGNTSEVNKENLKLIAQKLAHHLGTSDAYDSWWDPRSWTENDKDTYMILKDMTKSNFSLVAKIYPLYSDGSNLRSDLVQHLDKKYFDKIEKNLLL